MAKAFSVFELHAVRRLAEETLIREERTAGEWETCSKTSGLGNQASKRPNIDGSWDLVSSFHDSPLWLMGAFYSFMLTRH